MSQSYYSWCGTRLHLLIEDDVAEAYNQANDAYVEAQRKHKEIHGTEWNPVEDHLAIDWTPEQRLAWNKIADVINALVRTNGGLLNIGEEEMTSHYLIKL